MILPALLVLDFYIRAFTKLRHSPLSGLARLVVALTGTRPLWIEKAPKVFAARIGLILSILMSVSALLALYLCGIPPCQEKVSRSPNCYPR